MGKVMDNRAVAGDDPYVTLNVCGMVAHVAALQDAMPAHLHPTVQTSTDSKGYGSQIGRSLVVTLKGRRSSILRPSRSSSRRRWRRRRWQTAILRQRSRSYRKSTRSSPTPRLEQSTRPTPLWLSGLPPERRPAHPHWRALLRRGRGLGHERQAQGHGEAGGRVLGRGRPANKLIVLADKQEAYNLLSDPEKTWSIKQAACADVRRLCGHRRCARQVRSDADVGAAQACVNVNGTLARCLPLRCHSAGKLLWSAGYSFRNVAHNFQFGLEVTVWKFQTGVPNSKPKICNFSGSV